MKIKTLPPENKFPDCLFIKLHGEFTNNILTKILSILRKKKNIAKQVDLQLTIRFSEQELEFPFGTVSFGLRGGKLKLQLTNAKMPLETIKLTPLLNPEIEIEEKEEKGKISGVRGALSIKPGIDGKTEETNKRTTIFREQVPQVYTTGTEEEPIWIFQAKTNKSILMGILQKVLIGQLQIQEEQKPFSVTAIFEVEDEDICLTKGKFLFVQDINRNRLALLERKFVKMFIIPELKPYISLVELSG